MMKHPNGMAKNLLRFNRGTNRRESHAHLGEMYCRATVPMSNPMESNGCLVYQRTRSARITEDGRGSISPKRVGIRKKTAKIHMKATRIIRARTESAPPGGRYR
jgi:hypothetical protein